MPTTKRPPTSCSVAAPDPRTVQCAKCPWKKSTNPHDIPDGYSVELHKKLKDTIARPGDLTTVLDGGRMRVMACHHSKPGAMEPCVGWVLNQLGPGNNLALRMAALGGKFAKYRTVGPQHGRFEDTLPKDHDEDEDEEEDWG